MLPRLYLSNQKEQLADYLIQNLLKSHKPFSSSLLIVPDLQMKPFIQMQCAQKMGCAFGCKIATLHDAIEQLVGKPLLRQIDFSYLFHTYPEIAMKQLRMEAVKTHTDDARIQEEIDLAACSCMKWSWEEISDERFASYHSFLQEKRILKASDAMQEVPEDLPDEIHLFGFSYLPSSSFNFFEKIARKTNVSVYIMSPCMMFWSDICSDRYIEVIEKRIDPALRSSYKELLLDRNELLANLGKKGRLFSSFLEEKKVHSCEAYAVPEQALLDHEYQAYIPKEGMHVEKRTLCLLDRCKLDLLLLQASRKEKKEIAADDISVQIHSTKTILNEAEAFFDALLHAANRLSQKTALKPGDVVVSAPNIKAYIPHLERVLNSTRSPFSYQSFEQAACICLQYLLDLPKKRFSKQAILRLLSCAPFLRKHRLEHEDIEQVEKLFSKYRFEWGYDATHRAALFSKEGYETTCSDIGSWKHVESELMHDLLHESQDISFTSSPHILSCLYSIRSIFDFFVEWSTKKCSLISWLEHISSLLDRYFLFDLHEKKEYELIVDACIQLKQTHERLQEEKSISFFSFVQLFQKACKQIHSTTFAQKEVLFVPLKKIHNFEPKMLFLLGMNEDGDESDERAYDFIQTLLLPKDVLYISYQGFSFEEHQEKQPHPYVREFISYLEKNFSCSHDIVQKHELQWTKPVREDKKKSFSLQIQEKAPALYMDLDFLRKVSVSPLSPYFQKTLGLYIPFEQREQIWKLKREALFLSHDEFSDHIQKHLGAYPIHQAVRVHLEEEQKVFLDALKACSIAKNPKTIELNFHCKAAFHERPEHFVFPALRFAFEDKTVILSGSIQTVDSWLMIDSYSDQSIMRAFPDVLGALCSDQTFQGVFFVRDKKTKKIAFQDPYETLKSYVAYALECTQKPFALYPSSLKTMMQQDGSLYETLKKAQDPYLSLFLERTDKQKVQEYADEWEQYATKLFLEYMQTMSEK